MKKYRIKENVLMEGNSEYYVQEKTFLGWYTVEFIDESGLNFKKHDSFQHALRNVDVIKKSQVKQTKYHEA